MKKTENYKIKRIMLAIFMLSIFGADKLAAQNPIIKNQFTADPSARVFGDKVYLFPSHDILATPGKGRVGWFAMEDYHVFSSSDLVAWKDHGVIVTQNKVPWVKPDSYSMWAPDCIERNGKYYFYFPSTPADTTQGRGFNIGVAVADKPEGPYVPQEKPIKGVKGIDPNVFIDKDGQAYLYWSQGNIYGAKLKENMLELASEPVILQDLPTKGLKEGPYLFERRGIYYLTYPHVENKIERLEYAIGDNPLGPFKRTGVVMDESPTGCWTNHHSFIEFKNQWYLFYHHNDYSPDFDKARSVRIDSLFFNADGTIQKVIPTLRGVGLTNAKDKIQIDRYSEINNAEIAFIDTAKKFEGWKIVFNSAGSWVKYNSVDFGKAKLKTILLKVRTNDGGAIEIKDGKGGVMAKIQIPKMNNWDVIEAPVKLSKSGTQNLLISNDSNHKIEIDWLSFK
jgi:hypothetical protein